jgi:hypothetical protein
MIRAIALFLGFTALTGCGNRQAEEAANRPANASRFSALLAKCPTVQIDDTLAVYSTTEPEDESYAFRGVQIDSAEGMYLPSPIREGLASEMYGTFACGSFAVDGNHIGILLRTPALYSSNAIHLLLLDKAKDSITNVLELAQLFGDAGDFVEKKTWLYRNEAKQPAAFMWVVQTYDHSVEGGEDTTIERSDNYYLFDLTRPAKDTASTDAKEFFKTFGRLNRK